jgi:hypothetical protein
MKNLLRKLLCILPPEKGPAISSTSPKSGWVETTSDGLFHSTVQDTSGQRSKWTETTYTSTETELSTRKCKNCKCATKIVQKVRDRKSDTDDPDCSLEFIQQPTESGYYQHIISVQVGHMVGEWEKKGYPEERELEYGDQVNRRYSRYLGTLNCAGCQKYKVNYFLSVLLQDNEKAGGSKYYVTFGDISTSSDKAAVASSSVTEKLLATDREKEPGVSNIFTIVKEEIGASNT